MVKISKQEDGDKLVDISESSSEKLIGGDKEGGTTFRFTFPSDKEYYIDIFIII